MPAVSTAESSPLNPVAWPADRIERRATAALVPYARNARTHSDAQVAQIAASIGEWGFTNPVLIDETDTIIAGHGRVLAAARLGLKEVPVVVARGWSEAQKKAYVIADNKLTDNGGWDEALLKIELGDLVEMGFDLPLMGFSDSELAGLMKSNPGLTDPDEVPEPPVEPISQMGDVWVLGRHRLVCGDATKPDDVAVALAGVKPHLMVTDPPYGVGYDADWRNRAIMIEGERRGQHGSRAIGRVTNDDEDDWRAAWVLFPGDVAYVWHSAVHAVEVAESLRAASFEPRAQIIWAKQQMVIGRGDYHWQHEPCWYAVRKGKTGHWAGDRKQTTLWQIDKPVKSETGHSTQKPVECMQRGIENNSSPGQAVYDPFVGSGTTIIAAEMTGRACHAIEISPAYTDVAMLRWQNFTGEKAHKETV
jgi:DNA modification methylase